MTGTGLPAGARQAIRLESAPDRLARDRLVQDQTWLALAAFAAVTLLGVWARPLLPVDETRYLAVAWEMRLSGDWIVPHLNGAPYAHKPPLLFWLINLVWSVTGVSETAARLVGPAFGLGAIWATGRLARTLWPRDPGIGGRAALVLAGFVGFSAYAGLTMFDTMLTLAVVGGASALATAAQSWRGWAGLGVALAFGGLAKGPVILVHLVPLALSAPLWTPASFRQTLRGGALALGVGIGFISLWLLPAVLAGGPDYREAVLWTQSAGRVTNSFAHARPWWFFLALLPALLWPFGWSPSLWARAARLDLRGERGLRLAVIWAGAGLALFSMMSGKQAHYLMPTLPAFALILAWAMREAPAPARPAALPLAVLAVLGLAAALGLAPGGDAAEILRPPAVMALAAAGCLGLAWLSLRLRGPQLAALGLGLITLANLVFLTGAPGHLYDQAEIAALLSPADAAGVAVPDTDYNGEFTFAARLRNPVATLAADDAPAWLAAAPGRVLVARLDRVHPPEDPRTTLLYRGHPYGIWRLSAVTGSPDEK